MCVHVLVLVILGGLTVWEYILLSSPNMILNPEYKFPQHIFFHV